MLKTLWNLKGQLDESAMMHEVETAEKVKAVCNTLISNTNMQNNFLFVGHNCAFWTDSAKDRHIRANKTAIIDSIDGFIRKYFYSNYDAMSKLKMPTPFFAGEVWVLRAMKDRFVLNSNMNPRSADQEKNMLFGKTIISQLKYVRCALGYEHEDYQKQVAEMIDETQAAYEQAYGNNNPTITYDQFAEGYIQK